MSIGLLGKKIGMTSVYDASGKLRPVTVIAAGDNTLLRRLTSENDGYSAIQVGFDVQKESRVTKAAARRIRESWFRAEEIRAGISSRGGCAGRRDRPRSHAVSSRAIGSMSIGKSKGKGFQGVMKKHNFQARARRTVRRRTGATAPSAIVPPRVASGKTWACRVTWATSA